MKKLLSITMVSLLFFCISCGNKAGMSDQAKKNLEAVHAINNAIIAGDVSKLGDYIAEDGLDHAGEKGDIKGLDSIKVALGAMHSMYSDMKMDVIKELADDEYVFQWIQFSAVCKEAQMGMPAGSKVDMSSVNVSRFKDGKGVEHWEFMQPADMMKMMPSQNMDHMMMDTTKMKM